MPSSLPFPVPERRVIEASAHAKLNLALAVGPPLGAGDPHAGMHPICSWMHALELADDIRIERLEPGRPSTFESAWADGPPVDWDRDRDLAWRAHAALEASAGRALPVSIQITKRTPAGGGLGGGSSDGAAVLLALDELFDLGLAERDLREIARTLGSDVPFFVDVPSWRERRPPRPAIVSGLGDTIERLDRRDDPVTLVCPPFGCSTGEVYRAFDAAPSERVETARVRALAAAPTLDGCFNDLAASACRVEPRLRDVLDALKSAGNPHVSGSGSTVFLLDPDPELLTSAVPGCRVVPTRLA